MDDGCNITAIISDAFIDNMDEIGRYLIMIMIIMLIIILIMLIIIKTGRTVRELW